MDFDLSEDQRMMRDMAYKFAVNEMAPVAQEYDREEKFGREIWQKACEAGLVGAIIPEAYEGPGYGFLEQAIITEQLARIDLGLCLCIVSAMFGSEHIVLFGTDEQKKEYLPRLVRGEAISAGAFTEPDAGTDVAAIRTRAVKDGGDYVINGTKMFITNGTICNFMCVYCVTDPDADKHKRQSIILVESDRPGVVSTKIKGKLGIRASDTAEISFDNVRVPQKNLIGTGGPRFLSIDGIFRRHSDDGSSSGRGHCSGRAGQGRQVHPRKE